jgi:hypothetical protein
MVITTKDDYSNRDYKEGDYPTFNDIEYQAETETYLEKNPLARVALKSIMQNTKGDISKVLQNVDDDDTSKDLYYKLKGVPIPNKGYIFPGKPEDFQQYSEEEKNNSAIVRVKLSSLDPKKQKTLTGHELGHYGLRVLLDEGRIDKKLFDELQLADEKIPDINKEEALMHKLSSRDDFNAGTTNIGFVSNAYSNTLDSIAEDYLSGIANEDLGYAKGGDTMPMEQQMEMFAVGGLDDDGLSRDPISGNEIPPGSMANEVRDDVEAKLSDGEYVVPANVVRFFGVKFFEDLRTQAMQGLGAMEANGRIGGEPVPSDMPMQDQMAEIQPDVSDEEMQMLQGLMNEGGYVRGYANGGTVPKDVDLENPTPFNPSPFSTVGASFFSPYNPNVTPDPNLPPTTMPVTPSPESGISFVTMVNPATGEIQVVQFMGGNPVDANAYNQLLSNGYFIQGSPELAAYKEKLRQDDIQDPDTTTRPHPSEASISQLGQLIAESSKGGGSLLEMIPGITGAVTGKLATDYRNDISKALAKTIADTSLSDAERNAAQLLQNVWTNADLSAKQRKEAIAKAGIFKQPSIKNALGKKAGKYMSENWFGLATKEQLEKQFGSEKATTKAMTDALNLTEKKFEVEDNKYGSEDDFKIDDIDYRFGVTGSGGVDGDSGGETLGEFGGSGPNVDSSGNITNDNNDNNNSNTTGGSNNNNSNNNNNNNENNNEVTSGPNVGNTTPSFENTAGGGFMNKGGIVKKPKKKKTKKY